MIKNIKSSGRSPWAWIPTLYVAEGLPYFAVNTLTVLLYTNMGISKTEMAFYTGWLYLPWVIKPFWSPFVDLIRTKRWWIIAMQLLIALAMGGIAFTLPTSFFFAATLAIFWIMAFASATHDISADGFYMLALDERQQAAYVGVRSTFYRIASILGQGGIVMMAGYLETAFGNISKAWSVTFGLLSALFFVIFLYHLWALPRPATDKALPDVTARNIASDFVRTFITFFSKPHILIALAFMLLYRLPEALCIKMVQPFLKDSLADGGIGLSTTQIGFVNGTVGVIALLGGGILGGLLIANGGLKRWLFPMAAALTLPCAVYCYLAIMQPDNYILVATLIGFEQFGYGFGFTSFMLYLMYFSRGESQTSHYAFCTAFMALGMMLPGMAAGWLFEATGGYVNFFWLVMITSIITFAATALVYRKIPKDAIS